MTYVSISSDHESSQDSSESSHSPDSYSSYYSSSDSPMASGSTPSKGNRAASIPDNSKAGTMANALRDDLVGHVYSDATVKTFVEVVWGMDPINAQIILDHKFDLDIGALHDYEKIVNKQNPKEREPDLHEPFRRISRKLLKDICDIFDLEHSDIKTCLWDREGNHKIPRQTRHGGTVYRKPDLLDIFIPCKKGGELLNPDVAKKDDFDKKITWGEPRCVIEFKRTRGFLPSTTLESVSEKPEEHPTRPSSSQRPNRGKKPAPATGRRSRGGSVSSNYGATQSGRSVLSNTSDRSRKRTTPPAGDSDRPSKKPRIDISVAEGQLAEYVLEMFIPGTRHYSTGFLIDCFWVKIWYYDRTASIRTIEFNFNTPEGTSLLGLALFALSQASMKQVGFDPNLYKFTTPDVGAVIKQENIVTLERPTTDIAKSNVCFMFEAADLKDKPKKQYVFPVQDVIMSYNGVVGRGTFVAGVLSGVVGEILSTCLRALKISWQFSARVHEGKIISDLRNALPHWKKHLPDPAFYTKLSSTNLNLPRTQYQDHLLQMGITDDLSDTVSNRNLHVLVTDRYEKLWKCRSVKEFKQVFLDCLECHYHAHTTGGVLHRDISENNLMVYRPSPEKQNESPELVLTDRTNEALGVLNDFDMASLTETDGSVRIGENPQHHITGTLPFMARELLSTKAPPTLHLYRYDLESFFYLLIWAATHYHLDGDRSWRRSTPKASLLEKWNHTHSATEGKHLLFSGEYLNEIIDDRIEGWEDVWVKWITPLFMMFKLGQAEASDAKFLNTANYDFSTCGGRVTFQNFMKEIGETERGLIPSPSC